MPRGRAPVLGPQLGACSSGHEDSLLNLASLDFQRESLTFVEHSVSPVRRPPLLACVRFLRDSILRCLHCLDA